MMSEALNSPSSRLEFMKLISSHVHIPMTEMEQLIDTPSFSAYEDAHWEESEDWKDND